MVNCQLTFGCHFVKVKTIRSFFRIFFRVEGESRRKIKIAINTYNIIRTSWISV